MALSGTPHALTALSKVRPEGSSSWQRLPRESSRRVRAGKTPLEIGSGPFGISVGVRVSALVGKAKHQSSFERSERDQEKDACTVPIVGKLGVGDS